MKKADRNHFHSNGVIHRPVNMSTPRHPIPPLMFSGVRVCRYRNFVYFVGFVRLSTTQMWKTVVFSV